MQLLKFKSGNAKLSGIFLFDIPAGHTCPFANNCLMKVHRETGALTYGEEMQFSCFAARQENVFPSLRKKRWYNFDLLRNKSLSEMIQTIELSLPTRYGIVRVHESGDFFNQAYFDAWIQVAKNNPNIIFYAYTKSLGYWVKRLAEIPSNFRLTASVGGRQDELIQKYGLKYAKVVYSVSEAENLGLEIDHNDDLAWKYDKSFALLIHGVQRAGSDASKATQALKKQGITGYSRKKK